MDEKKYIALGKAFELFLSNERFRILGTAQLGEPGYQHIGMEVWTQYPDFPERTNETNKSIIYRYILGMKGVCDLGIQVSIEDLINAFDDETHSSWEAHMKTKIGSICMSIRHDYGLMDDHHKKVEQFMAKEYIHAIAKEL